jgi:hypothetical protein
LPKRTIRHLFIIRKGKSWKSAFFASHFADHRKTPLLKHNPSKAAAVAAPTPRANYGFIREYSTPEAAARPTPKLLTGQEESQLLDHGFDN